MLSIGFFSLSRSLTTVNYLPYSRVVFRRNNRSWVPGACQGRQRRAQPDEGVLFLTTFAVTQVKRSARNIHYGIGGVKIDRTIRAALRITGVFRKKLVKFPGGYG